MKRFLAILVCVTVLSGCKTENRQTADNHDENMAPPVKVELVEKNGKFQLLVNKEPFYIKGAGLEFGSICSIDP